MPAALDTALDRPSAEQARGDATALAETGRAARAYTDAVLRGL